jgi:DNA modification methylase
MSCLAHIDLRDKLDIQTGEKRMELTADFFEKILQQKQIINFAAGPYMIIFGTFLMIAYSHWQRIYSDNLTQAEYQEWLKTVLTNIAPFLDDGAPVYLWNGHRQFGPMHDIFAALGFHVATVITWAKPNFAISFGDYNNQTEFCLYGWKKENGAHKWYGPTTETTLWEISRDYTTAYIHPTQKPIAIPQRAIRNSSKRDDIVVDLFLGSGSTLIAAESLGRRCYGLEIDPKYCDAIVRRCIAFVGEENVADELKNKYRKEAADGNLISESK